MSPLRKAPIYQDHDKTYHADTCIPVKKAVCDGKIKLAALKRNNYPGVAIKGDEIFGINNIGYWDVKDEQNWGLQWHRNEGLEITFLEHGALPFEVFNNKMQILQPNDLTITRPWQPHKAGNPNVGKSKLHYLILDVGVRRPHQDWNWPSWIVLTTDDLAELTQMLRTNEDPIWHTNLDIMLCFKNISESVNSILDGDSYSRLVIYINELLMMLLEMFRHRKIPLNNSLTSTVRNVELFLKEIGGNVGEAWTLETMASCCGLGVTQFVQYCTQLTNMTPMQYLNHLRMRRSAKMLLEYPERKIIDIAFECGFCSSQYFATVFRRYYNTTPREFRKQYMKKGLPADFTLPPTQHVA